MKYLIKVLFMTICFTLLICILSSCNEIKDNLIDDTSNLPDNTDINYPVVSPEITEEKESAIGGGEEGVCPIHSITGYVMIPYTLIDYVGEDEFFVWVEDMNSNYDNQRSDACTCTVCIPTFIEKFNIPNSVILDYYYNEGGYYTEDWEIEALLVRDWETFDEYAQHTEHRDEMSKRMTEWNIKDTLIELLEKNPDPKVQEFRNRVTDNGTKTKPGTWSFAEYVEVTGIDRATLESIIASHAINSETGESIPIFEYNLDMLYEPKADVSVMTNNEEALYPVQLDALLHK